MGESAGGGAGSARAHLAVAALSPGFSQTAARHFTGEPAASISGAVLDELGDFPTRSKKDG